MSFPAITALVPDGEHFDSTALNEGIWLSEGHINNVESALTSAAANDSQREARIQQLTNELAQSQAALTEAQGTLSTANSTISTLRGEVATLREKPAAPITQTSKSGNDEAPGAGKKLSAVTQEANEHRALIGKPPIQ